MKHIPAWLEKAVFYNIYPQSFYDSNGDGIGDLYGIQQKLGYVRDMGFTAVWLNPFYVSPFRDAGYDVADFYRVDPRYGTNEDFVALCAEAHRLGIRVCIDLVAGHTALEHEWFRQSCLPERNEYTDRYVWTDDWLKDYDGCCIGGYSGRNGRYMRNFFYCQPALNYGFAKVEDPAWQMPMDAPACRETKRELIRIMEYWIGLGADGFRVDMAASLIKNDPDGSGIRRFWREIRDLFDKKYPECVLISEWSHPSQAIGAGFHIDFLIHDNLPAYTRLFRAEPGRNVSDKFAGHSFFCRDGNGSIEDFLADYLPERAATAGQGYISLPSGNHDLPRISYGRTKEELACVFAFLLTMPGVPFIYYGDEIGMRYCPELPSKEGGYNRTGARTPMQWDDTENAGFSTAAPERLYLPVEKGGPHVRQQLADGGSLLRTVQKLIRLRQSSRALCADGDITFLNRQNGGYPLVYRREIDGERYLIAINPLGEPRSYPVGAGWETALSARAELRGDTVHLQSFGYSILKDGRTER